MEFIDCFKYLNLSKTYYIHISQKQTFWINFNKIILNLQVNTKGQHTERDSAKRRDFLVFIDE